LGRVPAAGTDVAVRIAKPDAVHVGPSSPALINPYTAGSASRSGPAYSIKYVTRLPRSAMELTWHGHSTWYVTVGDTSLLIDPFFDNPHTSMEPAEIDQPDYVLLTHGHADHIAHAGEFTDATVVAPVEVAAYVEEEMGADDTIGMNIGGTVECGDAHVTMHRADHTS